ncbi:hypothetical protein VFPPC_16353 [Pochonia chlamydosporia 170]|uniref:Uncharacterized protein n=1 Tax=Pochonia chlamydosporia 170 TaxID=1380566 RepID=A0A179FKI3_METCM|nr:hypothetical protein VFPPC_16353 [Pochonia chlamydosporia 170]OAQ65519.1 hypothetical protein VFPPC_16353 [Pochonia chlamydosporia 170]
MRCAQYNTEQFPENVPQMAYMFGVTQNVDDVINNPMTPTTLCGPVGLETQMHRALLVNVCSG